MVNHAWLRDRPSQAKYPKTEGTPEQGSSSVGQGLGSGKGKQWLSLTNNNIYVESTDGSPVGTTTGIQKGKERKERERERLTLKATAATVILPE